MIDLNDIYKLLIKMHVQNNQIQEQIECNPELSKSMILAFEYKIKRNKIIIDHLTAIQEILEDDDK